MAKFDDFVAQQKAIRLADNLIRKASGAERSHIVERPVVLATSFEERADLPGGTLICKMTTQVATALAAIGLHEPVSVRSLPGKWWLANVDMAAVNSNCEPGGGATQLVVSSEELRCRYGAYYCEVVAGPFNSNEESYPCFFVIEQSRNYRDPNALYCELPSWMESRLQKKGLKFPIPFAALAGKYWVCGMSGGVSSTENIQKEMRSEEIKFHITDGPFDSQDDADYAYDVLWESPE
jgi:hypothetical protein